MCYSRSALEEDLGQAGLDELASGRRWSHCSAPLLYRADVSWRHIIRTHWLWFYDPLCGRTLLRTRKNSYASCVPTVGNTYDHAYCRVLRIRLEGLSKKSLCEKSLCPLVGRTHPRTREKPCASTTWGTGVNLHDKSGMSIYSTNLYQMLLYNDEWDPGV